MRNILASGAIWLVFSVPAMAQEAPPKLDEKGFAADYKALLKKHPGATYRFHLFDERDVKGGRSPRCAANCDWHPDVGVCTCPPVHTDMPRIWE